MAVLAMKRISIYALKSNRKKILELLQRRGAVEIDSPKEADDVFSKTDTASARLTFEKNAQQAVNAVSILDGVSPPEKGLPKMLLGRTPVTLEQYEKTAEAAPVHAKTASRILALDKRISDETAEILRLESQLDALTPWLSPCGLSGPAVPMFSSVLFRRN